MQIISYVRFFYNPQTMCLTIKVFASRQKTNQEMWSGVERERDYLCFCFFLFHVEFLPLTLLLDFDISIITEIVDCFGGGVSWIWLERKRNLAKNKRDLIVIVEDWIFTAV